MEQWNRLAKYNKAEREREQKITENILLKITAGLRLFVLFVVVVGMIS